MIDGVCTRTIRLDNRYLLHSFRVVDSQVASTEEEQRIVRDRCRVP